MNGQMPLSLGISLELVTFSEEEASALQTTSVNLDAGAGYSEEGWGWEPHHPVR